MNKNQQGKSIVAGVVTLWGFVSTALVWFYMFVFGMGMGTFSNQDFADFSDLAVPAVWASPVLGIVAAAAAIVVSQRQLRWRWMALSASITLVAPLCFLGAVTLLY